VYEGGDDRIVDPSVQPSFRRGIWRGAPIANRSKILLCI
jgi:hypothetical protein